VGVWGVGNASRSPITDKCMNTNFYDIRSPIFDQFAAPPRAGERQIRKFSCNLEYSVKQEGGKESGRGSRPNNCLITVPLNSKLRT